jgi:hypothetical protein
MALGERVTLLAAARQLLQPTEHVHAVFGVG